LVSFYNFLCFLKEHIYNVYSSENKFLQSIHQAILLVEIFRCIYTDKINLLVNQVNASGIITARLTITFVNVHRTSATSVAWQTFAIEPVNKIIALAARHTRI